MKSLKLTLLFLAVFATAVSAQTDPNKAFKVAKKSLISYYNNQVSNVDKLEEAKNLIDEATAGIEMVKANNHPKVYDKAGEIYLEIAKNVSLRAKYPDAPAKAYEFYVKTAEDASAKGYHKDAAKKGLETLGGVVLIQQGNQALQAQEYEAAMNAFEMVLKCKAKVDEYGKTLTFLLLEEDQNNIKFYTGYTAFLAGNMEKAKEYFEPLMASEFDEATVYSFLTKIYLEEDDTDKALAALNKGVQVLSNVTIDEEAENAADMKARVSQGLKTLLYDKINYYLRTKEMDKLGVELRKAIEQDPENAQLPFTLGQVYEDLSAKAFEAGNDTEGEAYFNDALKYYQDAVKVDPKFFDAAYQVGALYFNNAVRIYKVQANLGISKDDQKKSEELGKQIDTFYNMAWEGFKAAEQIKANDELLIIAFKQIYLRVNNTDAYSEYKSREEALKADPNTTFEPYTGHPDSLK